MITIIIYLFAVALAIPTGKPEATGSTRRLLALEPTKYTPLVEGSVCLSGWVGGSDGETQQGCEQLCTDHEDCGTYCHSPTTLPGQDFECLMYSRCDNFVKNFGPGGASAETFSCFTKNLEYTPLVEGSVCRSGWVGGSDGETQQGCEQLCTEHEDCGTYCHSPTTLPGQDWECLMYSTCDNFVKHFGPGGASAETFSCFTKGCEIRRDTDFFGSDIHTIDNVMSARACAYECTQYDGCDSWTWGKKADEWYTNRCFLKSGTPSPTTSDCCDSGLKNACVHNPTQLPTTSTPTQLPTFSSPTQLPTFSAPTQLPTFSTPTQLPTFSAPTHLPTFSIPTQLPSRSPSAYSASIAPTIKPTRQPTMRPSRNPSSDQCPSSFLCTRNAAIYGHNKEQLTDVTVEDCKVACCSRDWCESFDYHKHSQKCDLSERVALEVGGLKTDYSGNPYDHYSLPDRCPSLFLHARNAAIQGHNKEQLTDVTVEDCKAACCSRDWCKSFDYYKLSQKCDLSEGIALEVGGLKRDYFGNPLDHYSLPPACITGTFKTNEGFEKTMAPYRVGNVFVFGVRERTWFKMASVDLDGNFIECRHHSKSMTESMTDSQRADIWNDANKGGEYSVHSVKSCTQGF